MDRQRLKRLARGDASALAELYDAHSGRLFGLALWLTRRREDAEEVLQTVMVELAGKGEGLLSIQTPAAYLATMARREALDVVTRRGSRGEEPFDETLFEESERDAGRDSKRRSGRGPLVAQADALALADAVAELPAEQREVVFLHVYEGWSFREIGEALDLPTFTAASRYRLALEKLRKRMAGQGKEVE